MQHVVRELNLSENQKKEELKHNTQPPYNILFLLIILNVSLSPSAFCRSLCGVPCWSLARLSAHPLPPAACAPLVIGIAITYHERGICSKRGSQVPVLCTHRPSLLPLLGGFSEVLESETLVEEDRGGPDEHE